MKLNWKPGTMIYPLPPALVSCGTMENSNVLTVAWTGILCTDPAMTYVSIRKERHSYNIIKETTIETYNDTIVAPFVMLGGTDGRHYNEISDCVIRFSPLLITLRT